MNIERFVSRQNAVLDLIPVIADDLDRVRYGRFRGDSFQSKLYSYWIINPIVYTLRQTEGSHANTDQQENDNSG